MIPGHRQGTPNVHVEIHSEVDLSNSNSSDLGAYIN